MLTGTRPDGLRAVITAYKSSKTMSEIRVMGGEIAWHTFPVTDCEARTLVEQRYGPGWVWETASDRWPIEAVDSQGQALRPGDTIRYRRQGADRTGLVLAIGDAGPNHSRYIKVEYGARVPAHLCTKVERGGAT